jgi:ribosomal-protein-alanine N-acetyltransferase
MGGRTMKLQKGDIYIRTLEVFDAEALVRLLIKNRAFMKPFVPIRPDSYFTLEANRERIQNMIFDRENDKGYTFGIFLSSTDDLIGQVALTSVSRGPWQNANIGYFLDQQQNGKEYMTDAVKLAVAFAFEQACLHRVQGAVMPRNTASIRVLEKAKFRYEGLAKRYLKINGVWEDHKIYAITDEEFRN